MTGALKIYPVILCGGSGTRLWPVSRKSSPKQFVSLLGAQSLFQAAVRRTVGPSFAAPLIVTGEAWRFTVVEQLAAIEMTASAILIEPDARNTAPAILAAAHWLKAHDPDALMLVMPSDHQIADRDLFEQAVMAAVCRAEASDLVTFGIVPTHPETGYGYLELAAGAQRDAATPQALRRFVEKPDLADATDMVASKNYLWNAGIFLFSVSGILDAFASHAPEMSSAVSASVGDAKQDLSFTRLEPGAWRSAESISIDYCVMEKARNLAVMPFGAGWSDLGGWASVWAESLPDAAGNSCSADVTAIDCSGALLKSEGGGLHVVGIGLDKMIVVATPDAILVAPMSESQRVGEAVNAMRAKGVAQADASRRDERPWGWYDSIASGDRFQVKRIFVKPGALLSLQSHHHRAEHWIVVAGTAHVTIGDEVRMVTENQSVYVPVGEKHRLENRGKLPVTLIEVQTGAYLGEDDIIRYDDAYARA